jgi:asparagine synthase (glutamine-hydrolysing)
MCGIFSYLGKNFSFDDLVALSNKIKHRGPDSSNHISLDFDDKQFFLGFHRLAINGLDEISNQPLKDDTNEIYLIANAEIFNYKELIKENDFVYRTNSDCEVIIHMYKKYGIEETCKKLDGEFAFLLVDLAKKVFYVVRDQLGVRSLYWTKNDNEFALSSEVKALTDFSGVKQFPIGSYWSSDSNEIVRYYSFVSVSDIDSVFSFNGLEKKDNRCSGFEYMNSADISEEEICKNLRELFIKAVEKRMLSERKVACLLSGGLDSSTVSAIVARMVGDYNLNTYSIGMKGATDLKYAKSMATYIKSNHVNIELDENEFLDAIEKTIYQIESYDTTSVRASVGNYLVSLYIKEHSDDTVIFCGDVSDEIFASYRGFSGEHSDDDFYVENVKMLNNIQYFDILRSDKSISGAGLEARVPFADKDFIDYVMKLPPSLKKFNKDRMEKYLFRKAFEEYMPHDILWRRKEAFSDGVSSTERSWFQIIKEFVDKKYSDDEYETLRKKYSWNMPYDKESLFYREIFEKYYPNKADLIPYFWRHPFSTQLDPSARLLSSY